MPACRIVDQLAPTDSLTKVLPLTLKIVAWIVWEYAYVLRTRLVAWNAQKVEHEADCTESLPLEAYACLVELFPENLEEELSEEY